MGGGGRYYIWKEIVPYLFLTIAKTRVSSTTKLIFQQLRLILSLAKATSTSASKPTTSIIIRIQKQAPSAELHGLLELEKQSKTWQSHSFVPALLLACLPQEVGLIQGKETDMVLGYKGPLLLLKVPMNGWVDGGCPPSSWWGAAEGLTGIAALAGQQQGE